MADQRHVNVRRQDLPDRSFNIEMLSVSNEWLKDWPKANQALTELPRINRVTIEHKTLGTITRLFMGVN